MYRERERDVYITASATSRTDTNKTKHTIQCCIVGGRGREERDDNASRERERETEREGRRDRKRGGKRKEW